MQHRHLVETDLPSSAAIDDTIERGSLDDWIVLRDQAKADESVVRKILRVCAARCADPYAQRHHLWRLYAQQLASKIDQDRVAATPQWELPKIRHMGLKADPFADEDWRLKTNLGE